MTVLATARRALTLAPAWLLMLGTLLIELLKSTWATLRLVYAPRGTAHPGIVAVPTSLQSPVAITTLANMITLTPGTTTLDVEKNGRQTVLYVHALDLDPDDPATSAEGISTVFEPSIRKVWP